MVEYDDPKCIREYAIGLLFRRPPVFSEYLRVGANMKTYYRLRPKERQYVDMKVDEKLNDEEVAGLWKVKPEIIKKLFYTVRKKYKEGF